MIIESFCIQPIQLQGTGHPWLSCIIYWDEDEHIWIGHCLEIDLQESCEDKTKLREILEEQAVASIHICKENNIPFLNPAPQEYWDLLSKALQEKNNEQNANQTNS